MTANEEKPKRTEEFVDSDYLETCYGRARYTTYEFALEMTKGEANKAKVHKCKFCHHYHTQPKG